MKIIIIVVIYLLTGSLIAWWYSKEYNHRTITNFVTIAILWLPLLIMAALWSLLSRTKKERDKK